MIGTILAFFLFASFVDRWLYASALCKVRYIGVNANELEDCGWESRSKQ
jgi:hypothetical protein